MKSNAIILWENRSGYCLVLFDVPDPNNSEQRKKYLLKRFGEWTVSKKLYKMAKNVETTHSLEDSRELWSKLIANHSFEQIDTEVEIEKL